MAYKELSDSTRVLPVAPVTGVGAGATDPPTGPISRLSNLGFRERRNSDSAESKGIVGALIIGAVALVIALMALTVTLGRAPQPASAGPSPVEAATSDTPAAPTSYQSPEQSGIRYTPEPIVTGVTQMAPPPPVNTGRSTGGANQTTRGGYVQDNNADGYYDGYWDDWGD